MRAFFTRALDDGWLVLAWVVGVPSVFALVDEVLQAPIATPARICSLFLAVALVVDGIPNRHGSMDHISRWFAVFLIVIAPEGEVGRLQGGERRDRTG